MKKYKIDIHVIDFDPDIGVIDTVSTHTYFREGQEADSFIEDVIECGIVVENSNHLEEVFPPGSILKIDKWDIENLDNS